MWEHLWNVNDSGAGLLQILHQAFNFFRDLLRVGGAGEENHLSVLGQQLHCPQEVRETLLAGDPANEDNRGAVRVDAVTVPNRGRLSFALNIGWAVPAGKVDAVVDHYDAVRVNVRVGAQNVVAHAVGNGDNSVRVLVRDPLSEGGHGVSPAQLLFLPRAERLQRVGRNHEGHVVQQLA